MIHRRGLWVGLSNQLKMYRIRRLCSNGENGGKKVEKRESSVSRYEETYKKLDKLDFVTAAKILFTEPPPKTKKFGFDWHVVQFILVCLPSVAVYLVAQYARHKMKIMDAELGEKKRKEDEKKEKEEAEQKLLDEEAANKSHQELLEVKLRLGQIEETIKEITRKPSTKTKEEEQKVNVHKPGESQANVDRPGPH